MTTPTFQRLALLGLLVVLPMSLAAQDMTRSFDVERGQRLDLRMETGGDITVTAWDRNEVSIKAWREGRDADDITIEMDDSRYGVVISTEFESRRRNYSGSVDFEIMVPARFDVELNTMGGDVNITGIEGEFEGQTMGGDIELRDLKGEADLQTMGGEILVMDSELDGKVHTMGGSVRVEDVSGGLDASSMGGTVRFTGQRGSSSNGPVKLSTMGGAIKLDDAPEGAEVSTMGGAITIRSAREFVEASTMGGPITINEVDGWVEASTMGGDVEVTMVGDPDSGDRHVELSSMGGDIELTVPDGLDMDIDIELTFTRRHEGDYRIISDFNLSEEITPEWDGRRGDARKTLYAEGKTGSGKNRITISTVNGNIILKRGR